MPKQRRAFPEIIEKETQGRETQALSSKVSVMQQTTASFAAVDNTFQIDFYSVIGCWCVGREDRPQR